MMKDKIVEYAFIVHEQHILDLFDHHKVLIKCIDIHVPIKTSLIYWVFV